MFFLPKIVHKKITVLVLWKGKYVQLNFRYPIRETNSVSLITRRDLSFWKVVRMFTAMFWTQGDELSKITLAWDP